jgi:hypothetical protein
LLPLTFLAEAEPDLPPPQNGTVHLRHPLDLALLDPGLPGVPLVLRVVRPLLEAQCRLLEERYLLLLGNVELLPALERELSCQRVGRVVTGPGPYLPILKLGDLRDRLIQQVAVVGDDNDGPVEAPNQGLQRSRRAASRWDSSSSSKDIGAARETGPNGSELALLAAELGGGPVGVVPMQAQRPDVAARLALEPPTRPAR